MGYKDEAGAATSGAKGSPFDPQLGAAATPAQGSVFQADSFASSDPAQGSVFSGSDTHTRGPQGPQGPQGIGINTVTGVINDDRDTDVTVTFSNPTGGPTPNPMMFTVQHGLDATGAGAVEIGFRAPGHEDHSGGENDGEIIIGNSAGDIISALPVDVRATSNIISDDNGLVGIESGRIVFNVSTAVQAGDERPVTSAAVFTALGNSPVSGDLVTFEDRTLETPVEYRLDEIEFDTLQDGHQHEFLFKFENELGQIGEKAISTQAPISDGRPATNANFTDDTDTQRYTTVATVKHWANNEFVEDSQVLTSTDSDTASTNTNIVSAGWLKTQWTPTKTPATGTVPSSWDNIGGNIPIYNSGGIVEATPSRLTFTGTGVAVATDSNDAVTIDISGGGSISPYDSNTTYVTNDIVYNSANGIIYRSITDDNRGNALTNVQHWLSLGGATQFTPNPVTSTHFATLGIPNDTVGANLILSKNNLLDGLSPTPNRSVEIFGTGGINVTAHGARDVITIDGSDIVGVEHVLDLETVFSFTDAVTARELVGYVNLDVFDNIRITAISGVTGVWTIADHALITGNYYVIAWNSSFAVGIATTATSLNILRYHVHSGDEEPDVSGTGQVGTIVTLENVHEQSVAGTTVFATSAAWEAQDHITLDIDEYITTDPSYNASQSNTDLTAAGYEQGDEFFIASRDTVYQVISTGGNLALQFILTNRDSIGEHGDVDVSAEDAVNNVLIYNPTTERWTASDSFTKLVHSVDTLKEQVNILSHSITSSTQATRVNDALRSIIAVDGNPTDDAEYDFVHNQLLWRVEPTTNSNGNFIEQAQAANAYREAGGIFAVSKSALPNDAALGVDANDVYYFRLSGFQATGSGSNQYNVIAQLLDITQEDNLISDYAFSSGSAALDSWFFNINNVVFDHITAVDAGSGIVGITDREAALLGYLDAAANTTNNGDYLTVDSLGAIVATDAPTTGIDTALRELPDTVATDSTWTSYITKLGFSGDDVTAATVEALFNDSTASRGVSYAVADGKINTTVAADTSKQNNITVTGLAGTNITWTPATSTLGFANIIAPDLLLRSNPESAIQTADDIKWDEYIGTGNLGFTKTSVSYVEGLTSSMLGTWNPTTITLLGGSLTFTNVPSDITLDSNARYEAAIVTGTAGTWDGTITFNGSDVTANAGAQGVAWSVDTTAAEISLSPMFDATFFASVTGNSVTLQSVAGSAAPVNVVGQVAFTGDGITYDTDLQSFVVTGGDTTAQVETQITGRLNAGSGTATNDDDAYTTTETDRLLGLKQDTLTDYTPSTWNAKQDALTVNQLAVVNANPFTSANYTPTATSVVDGDIGITNGEVTSITVGGTSHNIGSSSGETAAQVQTAITGRLNDGTGTATNNDDAYTTTENDRLLGLKQDTISASNAAAIRNTLSVVEGAHTRLGTNESESTFTNVETVTDGTIELYTPNDELHFSGIAGSRIPTTTYRIEIMAGSDYVGVVTFPGSVINQVPHGSSFIWILDYTNASFTATPELPTDDFTSTSGNNTFVIQSEQTTEEYVGVNGDIILEGDGVTQDGKTFTFSGVNISFRYQLLLTNGFLLPENTIASTLTRDAYIDIAGAYGAANAIYWFDNTDDSWYSVATGGTALVSFPS